MEFQCGCGICGQPVPYGEPCLGRGTFKPGHHQKLRILLERRMGGIEGLRALVNAATSFGEGTSDSDDLAKAVKAIFAKPDQVQGPGW